MTAAYWIVIACGVLALLYGMYAYRQVMAAWRTETKAQSSELKADS